MKGGGLKLPPFIEITTTLKEVYAMVLFSCNVKELKTAVSKAGNLLNRRATGEALKSVAVELAGDSIYIKATDLQSFGIFKVPVIDFSGSGKFLLEAKQFLQALKSLKGKVKAKFKDSLTLELSDERQAFYVKVSDYSYPDFPSFNYSILSPIPATILTKAIDKVVYILDKSDRTNLNYMLIKGVDDNKTDFVATDGYRLALYSPSINFTGEVKIYKDVIKVLKNLIKDVKGDVMIGATNDYLYVKADNWELITLNSNMIYPNYQYLISSYDKVEFNEFYIDKEMYINGLKYLKTSIEKDEVFALKLSITEKAVFEVVENGEGMVELPVKDYKGNPVVIGINGDFLLEALSGFDTDLIKVKVSDIERPVFLESVDKDKDPYMCLVMPRKL
jgi:DNA polymerase-3 subunit beta